MKLILIGAVALIGLLVSTFALFNPAQPKADPGNITFQENAMRVPVLLQKISDQTGLVLASSGLENEVVLVHVENVPIDELLDRIAVAASGTWTQEGDKKTLRPDTKARAQETRDLQEAVISARTRERAALEQRLQQIRQDPDAFISRMKEVEVFSRTRFDASPANLKFQAARHELILSIPLDMVIQASLGPRVVFSSNPNQLQLAMPAEMRRAVDEYITAFFQLGPEPDEYIEIDGVRHKVTTERKLVDPNQVSFAILSVTPFRSAINPKTPAGGVSMMLNFFDDRGDWLHNEILGGYGFPLYFEEEMFEANRPESQEQRTSPEATKPPIKLRQESIEMLRTLRASSAVKRQFGPPSQALLKKLPDIETYDPHSFDNSDLLVGFSRLHGANLVAGISDVFIASMRMDPEADYPYNEALKLIETHYGTTELEDGWLVLKPRFAEPLRAYRTSRSDLRRAHLAGNGTPTVPLTDQMAFAVNNPPPTPGQVTTLWVGTFAPGLMGQYSYSGDFWGTLRMFGRFGMANRNKLIQGEEIRLNDLSGSERQILKDAILDGVFFIRERDERRDNLPNPPHSIRWTGSISSGASGGIEPTLVLANGLPEGTVIRPQKEEVEALLVADSQGSPLPNFPVQSTEQVALTIARGEEGWVNISGFDRFRLAQQRLLHISLLFGEPYIAKVTLQEDIVQADSPLLTRSQLPQSIQVELDELIANHQAEMKRFRRPLPTPQP